MKISNDWLAGIGTGLGVGAGAAMVTAQGGAVLGGIGVAAVAYAIGVRRGRDDVDENAENGDTDEVATDGGTAPREPQPGSASTQPTVLDVEISGDRVLGTAERGDVSIVVEAPAGISADELEQTLSGVPESIERTTERFAGATTMSANTTEIDGSTDAEDATDDDVGGGA
ncbi:hypothetical protein [Halorubrum salinum]|uniref:hypothetical protein n=1 Tax=Halorubrum salinum TaxID=767517 RepID=UPI0021114256|nr:hypothetical protein [Halorubrum salinum]